MNMISTPPDIMNQFSNIKHLKNRTKLVEEFLISQIPETIRRFRIIKKSIYHKLRNGDLAELIIRFDNQGDIKIVSDLFESLEIDIDVLRLTTLRVRRLSVKEIPGYKFQMEDEFSSFSIEEDTPSKLFTTFSKLSSSRNNTFPGDLSSKILDIRKESTKEAFLLPFNVEHRLEHVALIEGVSYWNDSKAININAAWFALESIDKPIIWIASGQDRSNDYTPLVDIVREKVSCIICLGKETWRLQKAFRDVIQEMILVNSIEEAVLTAYRKAKYGDAVVLSPGCPSFDLFEDYEDRGRQFKQAVRSL